MINKYFYLILFYYLYMFITNFYRKEKKTESSKYLKYLYIEREILNNFIFIIINNDKSK